MWREREREREMALKLRSKWSNMYRADGSSGI